MENTYEIKLGQEVIGAATVQQQGLYYRIRCRCQLTGSVIYRLRAVCGEQTEDLGILVPDGGAFCLEKRLPVKRLGSGALSFRAVPHRGEAAGRFIPIRADAPFAYLASLENAYLQIQNGEPGIVIR